jgi:hypothetical protein
MSSHILVSHASDSIGFNNVEFPQPIALSILQVGSPGAPGLPGRSVEMQSTATHIQYRLQGSSTWLDLLPLADLQGADGLPGADGQEIQLRATATDIEWKYLTDLTWTSLVSIASLQGIDGTDGREIELQKTATEIQWRYVGTGTWFTLVLLADIKGANGTNGTAGADGTDGVGISSSSYNSSTGILTLNFSDSTSFQTGDLRGSAGATGSPGAAGTNATVAVGTVTTGLAGSSASITNVGTASNAVFNFTIPRGDAGAAGATGAPGAAGTNGVGISNISYNSGTGVITFTLTDSSTYFTADLRGAQGIQGIQGPAGAAGSPGADGSNIELQTSATHVQWRVVGSPTWIDLVPISSLGTNPNGLDLPILTTLVPPLAGFARIAEYSLATPQRDTVITYPSGNIDIIPPPITGRSFSYWAPGNAAGIGTVIGTTWLAGGTISTVTPGTALTNHRYRTKFANAATTPNQNLGILTGSNRFFRASVTGLGGFYYDCTVKLTGLPLGCRTWLGLGSSTLVGSDTPAATSCFGFYQLTTDAADSIRVVKNGGATIETVQIVTLPDINMFYRFIFRCLPNSNDITWVIINTSNQTVVANGTTTDNLPVLDTLLTGYVQASNGTAFTTANAVFIEPCEAYIASLTNL